MGLFKKKSVDTLAQLKANATKQQQFDTENVNMCQMGLQAEKAGDIQQAMSIYETLLQRGFDGTAPYKSLCDIYHKQKRYVDEIRVINRLRQVTPKDRYKEGNKYRWYDERFKELTKK